MTNHHDADPPPPESEGGLGGERGTTRDTRALANAVAGGWLVDDDDRQGAIAELTKIVRSPKSRPRERLAAIRGLQFADRLALEAAKLAGPNPSPPAAAIIVHEDDWYGTSAAAVQAAIAAEPEYLEWLRQQALNDSAGPSANGQRPPNEGNHR